MYKLGYLFLEYVVGLTLAYLMFQSLLYNWLKVYKLAWIPILQTGPSKRGTTWR